MQWVTRRANPRASRQRHSLAKTLGAPAVLAGVIGCGSSPPPTTPTPPARDSARANSDTGAQVEQPLLHKVSQAPTRELSLAELAPEVATFIVGPDWAPLLERTTFNGVDFGSWLVDRHVVEQEPNTGRYVATLTRTRIQQVLDEFGSAALPVTHLVLPAAWQTTVLPALGAEREWALCQRRQELLGVTCERPVPLDARLSVANLFSSLTLQPLLPDGIPVRENGEAAWSLDVRIVSQANGQVAGIAGVPVALVEVEVAEIGAVPLVHSDENGWAHFPFIASNKPSQVHIASKAALGPLAPLTETTKLPVHTRALHPSRLAVVETNDAASYQPGSLGTALNRELALTYGKPLPALSPELTRRLAPTTALAPVGTTALPAGLCKDIVESTRGAVDYLVVVSGDAEFASQMGADRTWYQARARAALVEVWSGQVQTTFDEQATGSGFGDQAAAQAAQLAVARALHTKLQTRRSP